MAQDKIEITAELKDLISGQFQKINDQVNKLENSLKSVDNVGSKSGKGGFWNMDMNLMSGVTAGNLLSNAISNAGSAVLEFGKDSIRAFGQQEQFLTSLKTMFHGNREEAEMLNGQLQNFAKTTPFELTEIQDATKMMIAYGSTSGSVVNEMRMLGDISSGVGAPLKDIAYLYGTLRTQGRAYTQDIRQFTGRGIPIIQELAKQFKVSESAVMNLVEKGKVGFPEVEKALKSMTEAGGQFSGMMDEQSKTLNGQISNLSDAWEQLKVGIGSSQSGILKNTIQWASDMVNAMNRSFQRTETIKTSITKFGGNNTSYLGGSIQTQENLEALADMVNNSVVAAQSSKESAIKQMGFLQSLLKVKVGDYQKALPGMKSEADFSYEGGKRTNEISVIRQAIREINQSMKSFNKVKDKEGKDSAKTESKASDLEKVAKANRPTQVNINIENLVREYTNEFNSAAEALKMTPETVARVLIGAVNDISTLQFGS